MENKDFDSVRFEAVEETTYHTSNALEALLNILVEKGVVSERELIEKMDSLLVHDDAEELGFDADAPRDSEDSE